VIGLRISRSCGGYQASRSPDQVFGFSDLRWMVTDRCFVDTVSHFVKANHDLGLHNR